MTKTIEWKLLIATSDESEAHILKNRLASEGIRCRLKSENSFPGTEHGGRAGEVQVYVPIADFEACQQIVETDELGDEDQ